MERERVYFGEKRSRERKRRRIHKRGRYTLLRDPADLLFIEKYGRLPRSRGLTSFFLSFLMFDGLRPDAKKAVKKTI